MGDVTVSEGWRDQGSGQRHRGHERSVTFHFLGGENEKAVIRHGARVSRRSIHLKGPARAVLCD